jgi:hypothetical protein
MAGALSPVLRRPKSGSETTEARNGLRSSRQARRTPSSTISWSERFETMRAPSPTFMKICAVPVSWQIGRRPKAAMRELTRICAIASRAAGLSSRRQASARFWM